MSIREKDDLNLPEAPDFISTPPKYTATQMAQMCEQMLPFWNKIRYSRPEMPFLGEAFSLEIDSNATLKPQSQPLKKN